MRYQRRAYVLMFGLLLATIAVSAGAQTPRIGVVDVDRLVNESPQASRARTSMAKQFARRKNELEAASENLRQDMERLNRDGSMMSDDDRARLQTRIRERQRELQMRQGQYNDDVGEAEQKEFKQMRADIRRVIDAYAREQDFDLMLGDGVLYATDAVDVTDEILDRLQQR